MHIAGVVVQSRPENLVAVQRRLEQVAGVEVHAVNPDGRFVVTIEDDHRHAVADRMYQLNALKGVLSAFVVYEESEFTQAEASQ